MFGVVGALIAGLTACTTTPPTASVDPAVVRAVTLTGGLLGVETVRELMKLPMPAQVQVVDFAIRS